MTPASTWVEKQAPGTGWQERLTVPGDASLDYFIDVLFEGTVFFGITNTYVERTVTSGAWTEKAAPGTVWTERPAS